MFEKFGRNVGIRLAVLIGTSVVAYPVARAQPGGQEIDALRSGRSFIETNIYSAEQDRQLLKLFDGLRVADVSDGMDQAGLANVGLVSAEIGPLWRDTQHFKHRIVGVAVTARYVPTNQPRHGARETDEFNRWMGEWYSQRSPEPFVPLLREGGRLEARRRDQVEAAGLGHGARRLSLDAACFKPSPSPL